MPGLGAPLDSMNDDSLSLEGRREEGRGRGKEGEGGGGKHSQHTMLHDT